jgi:putative transposase
MIGIDLGIKTFATLSTSEVFEAPSLKKLEKQIKVLQQRFSKKQKSSNNKEKSRLKLAKKYEKLTNVRNNFLHSITSKIIRENQTIVLEDLNVSGMMKNHKLARSIQRLSLFEFRRQIEYKAKWYNRNVVFVNRFYPSSKTCSNCGHKKTELKLSERVYNCDNCNVSIDRDLNASFNILNEGKRILGLSSPEVKLVDCLNRNSDVFGELTSDRVKQEKECCSLNFTE